MFVFSALRYFDVSKNKIKLLPGSLEMLRHLEQLYIQHNSITSIPPLTTCVALKVSNNLHLNDTEEPGKKYHYRQYQYQFADSQCKVK